MIILNFNKYKIIISGIILGVLFWIIESIMHTLVFDPEENLIQHLFFSDAHELWMRTLVILFIAASSVYSQIIFNKVKTNEQELKESEEKFRYFFNNAQVGLFWSRISDGKFLECNDTFAKLVGYDTREECLADYIALEHYVDSNIRDEMLEEIRINDEIKDFEIQVTKRDGTPYWASISARTNLKENRIEGAAIDVTARKEAEQKLKESEEKYRLISENSNDLIAVLNSKFEHEYINEKAYQKILGYSNEDMLGKTRYDIIHPDEYKRASEVIRESIKKGSGTDELRLQHKNGKYIWVENKVSVFKDSDGQLKLTTVSRVITDRKKAEKEIQLERDNLINILSSMEDGVYIVDKNYDIEYANPILIQEFGQYEGKKCYNYFHDRNESCPWCNIQEVFEGKAVKWEWYSFKNQKTYALIDTPLKNADGSIFKLEIFHDITERKKNEQKLKESEEKYRTITEGSHLAISIIQDDIVKYTNQKMADLTGYSIEEILSWKPKEFAKVIAPDSLEQVIEQVTKKQRGDPDVLVHYPIHVKKKSGELVWADNISTTIMYEGHPADLITQIDITEKVEAQVKLKESEDKFRTISEQSLMGIIILQDDMYKYVNQAAADILGYTVEEMLEVPQGGFMNYVHPEDREFVREQATKKQMGRKDVVTKYPYRCLTKSGETIWVQNYSRTITYEGKYADLFTIIDFTERKKAEQKLKESEVKYRHLFETSPYFISLVNSEGILIDSNDAINDILSIHTIEDVVGKSFKEILLLNEKSTHLIPIFEKFIKSIFEGVNQEGFDFRLNRSIGDHIWIHIEGTLIEIEEQKLIQFIMQDITERKRSEQLLRESLEDLAKINTELEQFTYIASHDLKEPLRMISSFTQLLEKRYKDKLNEDANDFISFITDGVARMQDLINSLLNYSRIGKNYKEFEKVDLNDVLKDVIDNLKPLINETNAEVLYDSLPSLFIDRYQLLQVFQNLISNAIKFHGKEPPQVHVSARPDNQYWVFSVCDNGIGIDPKDFERIFIIFQRLHAKDDYDGTGIGLAICKKIVEQYRGKIWMESEVGKGSTFYFSIPKK